MRAVLERDYVAEASRFRAFALRTLIGAVVGGVVFALLYERRFEILEFPDRVARAVFRGAGAALVAALALVTPAAIVGAVLGERSRETLALVLASPIGPASFAGAKFAARTVTTFTWGAAALVPLFLTTLLGGVGWDEVGNLLAVAAGTVIELAAWGLWISTVSRNLATASVLAYLLPLVRWTLSAGLLLATLCWGMVGHGPGSVQPDGWGSPVVRRAFQMAAFTTPVPASMMLDDPDAYEVQVCTDFNVDRGTVARFYGLNGYVSYGSPNTVYDDSWGPQVLSTSSLPAPAPPPPIPFPLRHPGAIYLLFALGMALTSLQLATRRLARDAEPQGNRIMGFLRAKRQIGAPADRGNPVAWKEERLLNAAASRPLYYTALAIFVGAEILLLLGSGSVLDREQVLRLGLYIATGHVALLSLAAVVAGAASMAHERAFGTLDLLRASPLTAREILDGKVRGLLRGLGLVGLLPLLHLLLLGCGGHLDPFTMVVAMGLEALLVVAWCGIGVLCGIGAPGMGIAVRRGVVLFGTLALGLPLAGLLLGGFLESPHLGVALAMGSTPLDFYFIVDGSFRTFNQTWIQAYCWDSGAFLSDTNGDLAGFEIWSGSLRDLRFLSIHKAIVVPWAMCWLVLTAVAMAVGRRHAPGLLARRFESSREDG